VQGFFTDTGTKWVRLVAEWEYFYQGSPFPTQPPSRTNVAPVFDQHRAALDANVILARQLGLRVILVTRGFAPYANGRVADAFELPPASQLQAGGAYDKWIFYLMNRYHPVNRYGSGPQRYRWIDFFEMVNEPNYECHPQSLAPRRTAQMFATALRVAKRLNANKAVNGHKTRSRPLRLLGPATSDYGGANTERHTDYAKFTSRLLSELRHINFPLHPPPHRADYIFAWAHHNYLDVRDGTLIKVATSDKPYDGNRAQLVRKLLTGTWAGYPSPSVKDPRIYLTEGGFYRGAYTTIADPVLDERQRRLLARAIRRLKTLTGSGQPGDGIEMFTQFLFYTTLQYDSGLCRDVPDPAIPPSPPPFASFERPAYTVWKDNF